MGYATYSERAIAVVTVAIVVSVFCYRKWKEWLRRPRTPDPWAPEISRELESSESEGVCLHCLSELPPGNWFCPHCGCSSGPYNTMMPFLYPFALGDALRHGTLEPRPFNRWQIASYILLSVPAFLGGFFLLALLILPVYWFLLWRNVGRSRRAAAPTLPPGSSANGAQPTM